MTAFHEKLVWAWRGRPWTIICILDRELTGHIIGMTIVTNSEPLPAAEEVAKQEQQQKSQEQLGKELESQVTQEGQQDREQLEAPVSESAFYKIPRFTYTIFLQKGLVLNALLEPGLFVLGGGAQLS